MRQGLSAGARGIAPGEPRRATRAGRVPPATQATSVLAGTRRSSSPAGTSVREERVAPRRPRPGPSRQAALAQAPGAAPAAPRRRSGRLLATLLALLALVLAIVAVVVLSAPAPTKVVLRNVVYSDV